jgi:Subtilase family
MSRHDDTTISLGGLRFDPLDEQVTQQNNQEDEPDDPDAVVAWIVQFHAPLDTAALVELRETLGLALDDFLPPASYVERLSAHQVEGVREDPRVRAVMRYLRQFKIAPLRAMPVADEEDDEPAPAPVFDAVLFPDADPDQVAAEVVARGGDETRVLDDRPLGGRLVVRFRMADVSRVEFVAALETVRWVEPLPETVDDGAPVPVAAPVAVFSALHGEGQVIGLIDKGPPDLGHCFFRDAPGVPPGPGHRKVLQVRNGHNSDPGDHATFTAGCAVGDDVAQPGQAPARGLAWAATLVCGNRLDLDDANLLFAELTRAAAAGAHVHSNSYHSKPQGHGNPATYDQRSFDVDSFSWQNEDHLVVGSSGNTGEEQGPPGTAKNALCVSCSADGSGGAPVGDGNPGPTADGRRKPDLTTTGCHLRSAVNGTLCETVVKICASSFATPRASAAAAIARQYFVEGFHPSGDRRADDAFVPTGALLKAVLLNATVPVAPGRVYPNDDEGWGHLDVGALLPPDADAARRLLVVDVRRADGLNTGDVRARDVEVADDDRPLRITLVWTDPPGPIGSDDAVVNDLDLVVTAPDGTVFLGNVLDGGVSVPGGAPDEVNNVEMVVVAAPAVGRWRVEVAARAVAANFGPQGFALVVGGGLATVQP